MRDQPIFQVVTAIIKEAVGDSINAGDILRVAHGQSPLGSFKSK
jgi:hypothetical protein